jgi:hypothetical protein
MGSATDSKSIENPRGGVCPRDYRIGEAPGIQNGARSLSDFGTSVHATGVWLGARPFLSAGSKHEAFLVPHNRRVNRMCHCGGFTAYAVVPRHARPPGHGTEIECRRAHA